MRNMLELMDELYQHGGYWSFLGDMVVVPLLSHISNDLIMLGHYPTITNAPGRNSYVPLLEDAFENNHVSD